MVPPAELAHETERLAARLASRPPVANGSLKRLMRESLSRELPAQLEAERDAFTACATTRDFREAVTAFLEKRPADYLGA